MRRALNSIVALVLSAMLALAGVGSAHARVKAARDGGALSRITICLGTSVVDVWVGADGKPVTVIRPCPEALPVADAPPDATAAGPVVALYRPRHPAPRPLRFAIRPRHEPVAARDPPLPVLV